MSVKLRKSGAAYLLMLGVFNVSCLYITPADARNGMSASTRLFAQKVIDDTLAMHPDLQSLELATIPPEKTECVTIASNEAMEIGEKCDGEELAALKTNETFVKKEKEDGKEVYEAILSVHDSAGGIIGIVGMNFKPEARQDRAKIVERAKQIAKEIESHLTSKEKMFESAK